MTAKDTIVVRLARQNEVLPQQNMGLAHDRDEAETEGARLKALVDSLEHFPLSSQGFRGCGTSHKPHYQIPTEVMNGQRRVRAASDGD